MADKRLMILLALPLACSQQVTETPDPGALVDLTMASTVGVLLDDLPVAERERAAMALLAESEEFWRARALMQVEATSYRLTYRNFYYDDAGQLPLPPREQWTVELGAPGRRTIAGHDYVAVDYSFTSTLLTRADQPGRAEPLLAEVGGVWEEPFVLPLDPDLLFQRTGYACMDEAEFPPNSVDGENALAFYDDTCEAGPGCHVSEDPGRSCVEALDDEVGSIATSMLFERLPWDRVRADEVRVADLEPGGPQLRVVVAGVEDHRIIYRYIPAGSCAIAEGCVGGSGWRRLLQFTATMHNVGDEDLLIGDVDGSNSPIVEHHMVVFSECHGHMHFNHYGKFSFGDAGQELGSKRAFCLESTSRYSNAEASPLVHDYDCHFQGTAAGWGDDYIAGIDCQWIDITPVAGPIAAPLRFEINPDGFLCEGELIRDADGQPSFEPTEFVNEHGDVEDRFVCEQREDAQDDNVGTATVEVPDKGGLINEPCERGQLGDKRDCGWLARDDTSTCTPGEALALQCSIAAGSPAQVVRACETSVALGHGIPCTYREALANVTIGDDPVEVSFACPMARDADEPGGGYSLFAGPAIPGEDAVVITCL